MILTRICLFVMFVAGTTCAPFIDGKAAMSKILRANEEINKEDIKEGDVKVQIDRQNALMGNNLRWPNNLMHFTFKSDDFSTTNKDLIRRAIKKISDVTCIKFKEHAYGNAPTDHVEIIHGSGCWSYIGMQGDKQQVSIHSDYCMGEGTIIHEILHALGVDHEQARKDRDEYIQVIWANIENGQENNFQKEATNSMGVIYDPYSVMQYGNNDWSNGNGDTLVWKDDPNLRLGGDKLSEIDILQLNLYYECIPKPDTTTKKPITTTTTTRKTTPKTTTTRMTTTKTTTTKKTTPKTTTTMKSTSTRTTSTSPGAGCGDSIFNCVYAHYNQNYCKQQWFKDKCQQTCEVCKSGDKLQCINFKNNKNINCHEEGRKGYCTIGNRRIRSKMKYNCTKTCCEMGRLYKLI